MPWTHQIKGNKLRKAENKILVVDDEPLICDFLYDALKSKGYSVVAVNNGQEAMNILRHDAVSAVISDVKMPKMSGAVLLKRVKELFPSLPVIMITGYGSVNDAVEIMKQGATDYIPKPFSVSKLHEVVEKSITSRIFEYKSNREIITEDKNMIKILETI
ncbi:response regulator, partial [Candidatus Poribacteria bacterium]|nr:response regulator [Candidatus Poribacteria bacterium]